MNRKPLLFVVIFAVAVIAVAVFISGTGRERGSNGETTERVAAGAAGESDAGEEDGGEEAEQADATRARLDALNQSRADGTFEVSDTGPRVSVPGWADEKLFSKENDWEPNAAADPSSGYVYMITTEYSGPEACGTCPSGGVIRLRISSDGGHTFGAPTFLCPCPGHNWQADPQIEVDGNGDVYAAWLTNPFGTVFSRSTDHGATWTTPVQVLPPTPDIPWNDHPWLAVSSDGQDVYIGVNHADNYQVSSHDYGATWSDPVKTNSDGKYYFSEGGTVLPDGDVAFSATAYGCCPYNQFAHKRPVDVHVFRSTDGGDTWSDNLIDTSQAPPLCTNPGCPPAQYGAQESIASDAHGNVLVAYNAANRPHHGERVFVRSSTDNGASFGPRQPISPASGTNGGVTAIYPQIAGQGDKHFAVTWADNRFGGRRFQTWERDTFDKGAHFTEAAQISNLPSGAGYKHPAGYQFNYGDYFDIVINNVGEAFAVWGEAYSYNGPGNTWYNVQNTP